MNNLYFETIFCNSNHFPNLFELNIVFNFLFLKAFDAKKSPILSKFMSLPASIMKSVKFTHWSRFFFVSKPFKSFKTVLDGFLWWKFRCMSFKCHLISQIYKNDLKNRWCRLSFFLVLIFYSDKLAVFFFDMKIRNLIGHSPALDIFWLRLNFPD